MSSIQSNKCTIKYNNFMQKNDLNILDDCYQKNITGYNILDALNPVNNQETCKLLTTKKTAYYKYKYNPSDIINDIETTFKSNKYKDELVDNIKKTFDLTPNDNCCKCIAISLYFKGTNPENFYKYLFSIRRSIQNIATCLPDYLVRLYLDSSVYQQINNLQNNKILNEINDDLEETKNGLKLWLELYKNTTYEPSNETKLRMEEILAEFPEYKRNGISSTPINKQFSLETVVKGYNKYKRLKERLNKTLPEIQKKNETDKKILLKLIELIFNSPNVEVYTYFCDSIINDSNLLTKVRTFRFLPMIDKEVSICVVREADGTVSNMDCHNIRSFEKLNKILYVVDIGVSSFFEKFQLNKISSYSKWLANYKQMIEYFKKKHNLVDILAGVFAIKLRVNKSVYDQNISETNVIIKKMNKLHDDNYDFAFDEVFLLHLFKDILSVNYTTSNNKLIFDKDHFDIIKYVYLGRSDIVRYAYEYNQSTDSLINDPNDEMESDNDDDEEIYTEGMIFKVNDIKFDGDPDDIYMPYNIMYYVDSLMIPINLQNVDKQIIDVSILTNKTVHKLSVLVNRPYNAQLKDFSGNFVYDNKLPPLLNKLYENNEKIIKNKLNLQNGGNHKNSRNKYIHYKI